MKFFAAFAVLAAAAQVADARISDSQLKEMLTSVNVYRAANGLGALILDQRLVNVAQKHSDDMANNNCQLDHDSPDGTPFSTRVVNVLNGQFSSVAENIAQGFSSISSVMTAWKNSKAHRDNLLRSSVAYVGFGFNTNCGGMWTQDFANFPKSTLDLVDSIGTFTGIGSSSPTPSKTTTTKAASPSPKTSPKTSPKVSPKPSPSPSPKKSPSPSPRVSPSPSPRPRTTTTSRRPSISFFSRPVVASPSPSPTPSNDFDSVRNFTGSVNVTNGTNGTNATFANGTNATTTATQTFTVPLEQATNLGEAASVEELVNALDDSAVSSNLLPDSQSAADGSTSVDNIVFSADLLPAPLKA